jgi:branched-chain amino acid transport system substrate-binding protein
MKLFILNILILFAGLTLLSACDKTPPVQSSGNTIKIGVIAPLSGSDLHKGKEGLKGINYILKTVPLLDNGDKIELYIKDDKNNPVQSIKALEELITKHEVSAVLTLSSSKAVLGLSRVADNFNTPIISLLATNPGITQKNKYITQLGYSDHFQGIAAALFVHDELLIDRIAVFKNSDNIYSKDLARTFKLKFESVRGQVLFDSDYINDNEQLKKTLLELRNKKVQLIYLPIKAKQVINVIDTLDTLEWHPKIMGADGLLVNIYMSSKNDINKLNGIITTDFYSSDLPMTDFGLEVKDGYEKNNSRLTSYSMMGIEGITLLKRLIIQCPSPLKRECIQEQLESGLTYTGLLGKISLNSDRVAQRVLLVNEINNGELNYIVQIY